MRIQFTALAVFMLTLTGAAHAQQDAREPAAADGDMQRERAAHEARESNRDRGFSDQEEAASDDAMTLCSDEDALAGRCAVIARLPRCPGPDPRCPDPTRVRPDTDGQQ